MLNSYEIGALGERRAARYLRRKGYKIITSNFKTVFGELDLIAKKGEEIVFVEVKTRGETSFGTPIEFVDREKMVQIKKTATYFMRYYNVKLRPRIDVIEVNTAIRRNKLVVKSIVHTQGVD